MSAKYVIFKPRERERNFLVSVLFMTMRMLFFVVLLIGLSCGGLMVGVAKAWIETAPELDLSVFNSQAQTSFIYDKYGTLVTEFSGTENRINVARTNFNNAAKKFNTAIRRFPKIILAGLFGFEKRAYFEAAEESEQAPKVEF